MGDRVGNSKNDKFLYTNFSLNYDLQRLEDKDLPLNENLMDELFDILAQDTVDTDDDGVVDFIDFCQYTEKGISVDERGCPFDKDKDRVFDFKDDELATATGSFVNEKGVTVTDEMTAERFLRYTDSTGNYTGKYENTVETSTDLGYTPDNENTDASNLPKQYVVVLGTQEKSISANDLSKYLGFKDFRMVQKGDTVYYIVGSYDNIADAVKRKYHLEKDGINTAGLAVTQGSIIKTIPENQWPTVVGVDTADPDQVLFRVQIGAFSKKLSGNIFKDVPDLLVIPGDDGITRYYSGAFTDIYKASERKIKMLDIGFEGAFVVAYKGGKRKPLGEIGVEVIQKENTDGSKDVENTAIDKTKIRYKVQVGAYKNDVPTDVLDKFLTIGGVSPYKENGMTKYISGNFTTKEEADSAMQKIREAGLEGSFVVAEYNGKLMSIDDLKTLLHEK
jgi:hypothetical protein